MAPSVVRYAIWTSTTCTIFSVGSRLCMKPSSFLLAFIETNLSNAWPWMIHYREQTLCKIIHIQTSMRWLDMHQIWSLPYWPDMASNIFSYSPYFWWMFEIVQCMSYSLFQIKYYSLLQTKYYSLLQMKYYSLRQLMYLLLQLMYMGSSRCIDMVSYIWSISDSFDNKWLTAQPCSGSIWKSSRLFCSCSI